MALKHRQVNRLSIPIEDFGIAKHRLNDLTLLTKRKRKTTFNHLAKFIHFSGLLTATDDVLSIAKGLDAAGAITVEVTYVEEPTG